ncbi:ribonuclease E/G [Brachybacterium sp. SGAir0954]|uniref:Rne/Rng family ribonuclease n=1 Tax=Brachybacterium sp. SGAir0954 TaxID=2571029 RepID=UPI0010CCC3DB|nr:Rne/Rng family ribonuclease [Brachybacterium sp. SGAir0954]QCR53833.1 ribonuclease E/G [Brachybacterium sp. SGAir0954]
MADSTTTPDPADPAPRRTRRRAAGAPAGAPAPSVVETSAAESSETATAPRTSVPEQAAASAEPAAPKRTRRRAAGAPAGAPVFRAATDPAPESEPEVEEAPAPAPEADVEQDTPAAPEPAARAERERPAEDDHDTSSVVADLRALADARGSGDRADEDGRERRERAQLDFASLLFQAPAPVQPRTTVGPGLPVFAEDEDDETPDSAEDREDADGTDADDRDRDERDAQGSDDDDEQRSGASRRRRRRGGRGRRGRGRGEDDARDEEQGEDDRGDAAGDADDAEADTPQDEDPQDDAEQRAEGEGRSSRSRSGRRRGRGRGAGARSEEPAEGDSAPEGSAEDAGTEGSGSEDSGPDDQDQAGSSSSSRRRRRRRRSDAGDGESTSPDDPPNTVVKVREARDEVKAVKGSTRLEAKKQRRREGRDNGRRRNVITEAEFLARRESVKRSMIVRERPGRTQIAVLEDDVLVEHYVAAKSHTSMVGNVYLGKVQNVLPSMEAAFVDIGKGRNAVLYAGEVNWDAVGLEGQPRRIELALKSGDPVLVQVTKDPIGHKGARLTSQISLPGRYVVFVPGGSMTGISRKLPDTERNRLKKIMRQLIPEDAGVIVRTAAEGASEEELTHDVERLRAQWEKIQKAQKARSAPIALSQEPDLAIKVVRDVFNEDFTSLIVEGSSTYEAVHEYVKDVAPDLLERVTAHVGPKDSFAKHRVDEQLLKAMDRKVYLPSGGSLVIDRTEAMTVIDVNTGKFTGSGGSLEETVTRNNLESAEEIVRQLRLRDIGGIIVIDFIDMVLESNRDLVLRRLVECLGRDRTKHQVAEVTSLGLVQMTRKRVGQGLVETFSTTCEHCNGRGVLVDIDGEAHQHGDGGGARIDGPDEQSSSGSSRSGKRRRGRGRGKDSEGGEAEKSAENGGESAGEHAEDSGDVHRLGNDDTRALARATIASIAAATTSHPHPEVVVDGEVVAVTEGEEPAPAHVEAAPADDTQAKSQEESQGEDQSALNSEA